jgi:hypothetical protein
MGPTGQPITLGGPTGVPGPNFGAETAEKTKAQKDSGWFTYLWQYMHESWLHGLVAVWLLFLDAADELVGLVIRLYGALQANQVPGFYSIVDAVMDDLIGISGETATWAYGKKGVSNAEGNYKVGRSFYEIFTALIGPSRPLTPQGGLHAAQSFIGFLIGFAVREANMELLSSLIPEEYRILDGVKQYGEAVRDALSFGRMARLALTPLLNILIADPLKWYLNQQYRPTLLTEAQLIRSQLRGLTTDPDQGTQLSYLGWSDNNINALMEETYQRPTAGDLYTLYRAGMMEQQQLLEFVQHLGTNQVNGQLMIDAEQVREQQPEAERLFAYYSQMFLHRQLDSPTFFQLTTPLAISPARQQAAVARISAQIETPSKRVTLGEMQQAYIAALVDLSEFEQYLINEGYTRDDATVLIMLELNKQTEHAAQVAVARYKYDKAVAKARAKGQPIPPEPAILAS